MNKKDPPDYFDEIYNLTLNRWQQLENDPELAAPWRQLFNQVQSPRHVISELLQNADDVGANNISTGISGETFYFQHDGKDFNKEEFASLCRFGFSNKRKLHTIGFRGIGFKSTFSLGEPVNIATPSLAVSFYKKRFTLPVWNGDVSASDNTEIRVILQDKNRQDELKKNLADWTLNPASLIFFNNIRKLQIGNVIVHKQEIVKGPVISSEKIKISSFNEIEIILFRSNSENFPNDAINEIIQERNSEETDVPPCHVELVLGLPNQKLFVVLPTGVNLKLPFSCNAPFLQDPSRFGIKSPSLSPTNRWLLKRIGKLGGERMIEWLGNKSLGVEERAKAYELLPIKENENDSLDSYVSKLICDSFYETIKNKPLLLTTTGDLVFPNQCYTPPNEAYAIWSSKQLIDAFGAGKKFALNSCISENSRTRLKSWAFISFLEMKDLLRAHVMKEKIPKPNDFEKLSLLWINIQKDSNYYYYFDRKNLSLLPVMGNNYLQSAKNAVRMPAKKEFISERAWDFLLQHVIIVDSDWFKFIEKLEKGVFPNQNNYSLISALLRDLGLNNPSDSNTIMRNATISLFSKKVYREEYVLLAHLFAALDARSPDEFCCYTIDGNLRKLSYKVIASQSVSINEFSPDTWLKSHLLHSDYNKDFEACSSSHWKEWIKSEKCGMWPFIPFTEKQNLVYGRGEIGKILKSRNVSNPQFYPYVTNNFIFEDIDFNAEIIANWEKLSVDDNKLWAKILQRIILSPKWYWEKHTEANVFQIATTHSKGKVITEFIPAEWIVRFKNLPCLFDTNGNALIPAELYARNPETEPFFGIEPFVKAELDNEATKPLLRLLGVREKQADITKVIDRLRALSRASMNERILQEVLKWYGVLERIIINTDKLTVNQIISIFSKEELIFTSEGKWERSSNVFISESEDYPDAPTVYPSTKEFSLWIKLGVENHPTVELIIKWLSELPVNETFESNTKNRIVAALKRFPERIWNTCRHWLAINNTWQHVESFKYRLTMQSLTKYADLFPHIKARCADFQMLKAEHTESQPFVLLPDLSIKIEYKLTREPQSIINNLQKPIWLSTIGNYLKRIKISDDANKEIVIENAKRLESSFWKTFKYSDFVEVTPYIDYTPAGIAQKRNVLWHDYHIFIREGSIAKSIRDIVEELARPFAKSIEIELIKSTFFTCIDRSGEFIKDYMMEYFTLEDESYKSDKFFLEKENDEDNVKVLVEVNEESGYEPLIQSQQEDDVPFSDQSTNDELDEIRNDRKDHHGVTDKSLPDKKNEPSLFDRFAYSQGFKWNSEKKRFMNHEGGWIEKSQPPFHWQLKNPFLDRLYWVQSQCLSQAGIEIPAEVWNFIEYNSKISSLILLDEIGNPIEWRGYTILSRKMSKKIEILPSSYIIRVSENQ